VETAGGHHPGEWDQTFAVNVRVAGYLGAAVLPGMAARRFGRLINIGSDAGGAIRPARNQIDGTGLERGSRSAAGGAEAKWTLSWPQQRATTRADRAAKSAAASAAVTERALTDRRTGQALPAV
jgi:NAD(P)-dependent dehydrogenase (short-subunit alcohol dehydrogenase family)